MKFNRGLKRWLQMDENTFKIFNIFRHQKNIDRNYFEMSSYHNQNVIITIVVVAVVKKANK